MSDVRPSALGSPAAGARSQPLMIGVHFRSPKCTAPQPSASRRQDSPTSMATSAADKFVIALDICRPSNSRSPDNAGRTPLGRARSQSPGRPADIAVRTPWRRAHEQGDCRRNSPGREAAVLGGEPVLCRRGLLESPRPHHFVTKLSLARTLELPTSYPRSPCNFLLIRESHLGSFVTCKERADEATNR
jgi:hypothetical protein